MEHALPVSIEPVVHEYHQAASYLDFAQKNLSEQRYMGSSTVLFSFPFYYVELSDSSLPQSKK